MTSIETLLQQHIQKAFTELFQKEIEEPKLEKTKPEFEGDFTLVVFPFLRLTGKGPEQSAEILGEYLKDQCDEVADFNVIKGFLNLSISDSYWTGFAASALSRPTAYAKSESGKGKKVMVEYSSPNTNKPLHLGHVRNNLLGYSVAKILEFNGYEVIKANLINDRGIHICKSMLAWEKFGNGETPESSGMKGDHLVGKYYVAFDQAYREEVKALMAEGKSEDEAKKQAPLLLEAQELLRKWEAGDKATIATWKKMNQWVYDGFDVSYKRLGVDFDKFYYESDTYLLGKDLVQEGLSKGVFYQKEDGSVWIDLSEYKLDQKLVLRSDGTSVYITQDLGTADQKFEQYGFDQSIYVVGNEQDYHFKVLFKILEKLGRSYAQGMYHLSYGMVDLPSGKMKSREGTVVDADDLMDEMFKTAKEITLELGKTEGLSEAELNALFESVGMGALKYFLLKVDPAKRILFDPKETIDFQGNTGPFLQYTYARISSLLQNAPSVSAEAWPSHLEPQERDLIKNLYAAPQVIEAAGKQYSPALIANYVYDVVKSYNRLYHDLSILKETDESKKALRLRLSEATRETMKACFTMLGIPVVERM